MASNYLNKPFFFLGTRWVNIPETEIDENQTQCHTSDDLETINLKKKIIRAKKTIH